MKRTYKKARLFNGRKVGRFLFILFILFISYVILTPRKIEVANIDSPNGERSARLHKFYYTGQPSYKVYYRDKNKLVWQTLFYLPVYTNTPHQTATETLSWSTDSQKLTFKINDELIWKYTFENN